MVEDRRRNKQDRLSPESGCSDENQLKLYTEREKMQNRKGTERKGRNDLNESGWLNQSEARGWGERGRAEGRERGVRISSVGRPWRRPQRCSALPAASQGGGARGVGGSFPLRRVESADALQVRQGFGLGQTPVKGARPRGACPASSWTVFGGGRWR